MKLHDLVRYRPHSTMKDAHNENSKIGFNSPLNSTTMAANDSFNVFDPQSAPHPQIHYFWPVPNRPPIENLNKIRLFNNSIPKISFMKTYFPK